MLSATAESLLPCASMPETPVRMILPMDMVQLPYLMRMVLA